MRDDIDVLLSKRKVPDMPGGLDERVILAARNMPQNSAAKKLQGFERWLSAFLEGFALPQPALALGLVLVIGLGAGVYSQNYAAASEFNADDISQVLNIDDAFDTGDFL